MLMPAAVLIVIILGAIAVDQAVVFGAQRDLVASAQAAANDAVAAGVDVGDLRAEGNVTVDRARIDRVVADAARRAGSRVQAGWRIVGGDLVVRFEREVEVIFSQGVPGGRGQRSVTATAQSTLVRQ